jgi:hypothetical protein
MDTKSREKNLEQCKKWRAKNREKWLAYRREWNVNKYKNNSEFRKRIREEARKKYKEDEKYRKKCKEYYQKNRERWKKYMSDSYYKNKHKFRARANTWDKRNELFQILGKFCFKCKSKENLQFHHTSYDLPKNIRGEEFLQELAKISKVICKDCHYELHLKEI